jgi:hypothetical protein
MSAISHYTSIMKTVSTGSTKMISMHEALARERISASRHDARMARIASEMAAARRWRRLERVARSAHRRHAQSAADAAVSVRWD